MDRKTGGSLGGKKGAGRSTGGVKAGSSAGGRHGSDARTDKAQPSGLQESSGEFRVGEGIIFGMRNGNILIRHSPQGDEVEVGEATLAGLMVDAFFTDKFKGEYPVIK